MNYVMSLFECGRAHDCAFNIWMIEIDPSMSIADF